MMAGGVFAKVRSVLQYSTGGFARKMSEVGAGGPVTIVLCYHRVTNEQPKDYTALEAGTPAPVFERQMAFLQSLANPIPAKSVLSDETPGLRFAITFDDGTLDNYEVAAPILERLGIPATFYVVTDFVGEDRLYWWEELAILMRSADTASSHLTGVVTEASGVAPRPRQSGDSFFPLYECIAEQVRLSDPAGVEDILDALSSELGVEREGRGRHYPLMGWNHLAELVDRGFDIGNHTRTHPNMDRLHKDCLEDEVLGAQQRITDKLGVSPGSFAFPYGITRECDDAALRSLSQLEVPCFSTGPGLVTGSSCRTSIPRMQLNQTTPMVWAHNVTQALQATPGLA